MIKYRSFLNTDVPHLIDVWRNQKPIRCLSSLLTRQHLDQMVMAKPYFDADGLVVAEMDDKVVGFVHSGFGPSADHCDIDKSTGVIAQLRIIDVPNRESVADELISKAKNYLVTGGVKEIYAGAKFPFSPFYMGLYGGSRVPGIPDEDEFVYQSFQRAGFQSVEKIEVLQRSLNGFRPPVSRAYLAIRRQFQVDAIVDPLLSTWWECCTLGWAEIFGFRIVNRKEKNVVGSVIFWDIEPLSHQWGLSTLGLVDLKIDEDQRRQGLATYLIGESLRHLTQQGRAGVEVQLRASDEPAIGVARRMGFDRISGGIEMKLVI